MFHRSRHSTKLVVLLLGLLCSVPGIGGEDALRLDRYLDLPGVGIKLRPFRDATQVPLPAPRVWIYEDQKTGERLAAGDPRELWYRDQHVATFRNVLTELTVARCRYNLPAEIPLINQKHIRPEYFKTIRMLTETEWTAGALKTWLQAFAGQAKAWDGKVKGVAIRFLIEEFHLQSAAGNRRLGYFLWPEKGDPFCLIFQFAASVAARDAERAAKNLLNSIRRIRVEVRNDRVSDQFQNYRRRVVGRRGEGALHSREQVVASIRNLPDWWYVETPNFIIKSNLPGNERDLAKRIQTDIELLRTAYEQFLPPLRPIQAVSVVTVFADRDEYVAYVPANWRWTSGIWMASRQELVISPSAADKQKDALKVILPTIYHEAFHQYLFYALDHTVPPVWFNEGHAMLFESAEIVDNRRKLVIGENPARVRMVESLLRREELQVTRVLGLSPKAFYDAQTVDANYARAWALVYFLRKAAHLFPEKPYAELCARIVVGLALDQDWEKVSMLAFQSVDLEALNADVEAFWQSSEMRRQAAAYRVFQEPLK